MISSPSYLQRYLASYLQELGLCIMAIPQAETKAKKPTKEQKSKTSVRELENLTSSINYEKRELLQGAIRC